MDAAPIGSPGCPEFAFWTASAARNRSVLIVRVARSVSSVRAEGGTASVISIDKSKTRCWVVIVTDPADDRSEFKNVPSQTKAQKLTNTSISSTPPDDENLAQRFRFRIQVRVDSVRLPGLAHFPEGLFPAGWIFGCTIRVDTELIASLIASPSARCGIPVIASLIRAVYLLRMRLYPTENRLAEVSSWWWHPFRRAA